jgi:hypothetical protein
MWESGFREDFLEMQPIRNKNGLLRSCLLTHRNEMSSLYRGPSINAFYQVSVHLAKQFQRRFFLKSANQIKKNGLWWPCLLTDRDKMSSLYTEPSIDASYQVSEEKIKM